MQFDARKLALAWDPYSDEMDFAEGVGYALRQYVNEEQSPWSRQELIVETLVRDLYANLRGGKKAARSRRVSLFALCCLSAASEHARGRCWDLVAPLGPKGLLPLFGFFFTVETLRGAKPGGPEVDKQRQLKFAGTVSLVEKSLLLLLVWICISGNDKNIMKLAGLESELCFFSRFTAIASRARFLQARSNLRNAQVLDRNLHAHVERLSTQIEETGLDHDFFKMEQELFSARQRIEASAKEVKAAAATAKDLAEARDIVWQIPLSWGTDENISLMSQPVIKAALDSANVVDVFLDELEGNDTDGAGSLDEEDTRLSGGDGEEEGNDREHERAPGQSMAEWREVSLTLLNSLISAEKMFSLTRRELPTRILAFQRSERLKGNDAGALSKADDLLLHFHCLRIFIILNGLEQSSGEEDTISLHVDSIVRKLFHHFRLASRWSSSQEKLCQDAIEFEMSDVSVYTRHAQGHCMWQNPTELGNKKEIAVVNAPEDNGDGAIVALLERNKAKELYFRCHNMETFLRIYLHDAGGSAALLSSAAIAEARALYDKLVSSCRSHRRLQAREGLAACRLQAIARGNACRRRLQQQRAAEVAARAKEAIEKAAIVVQRAWRWVGRRRRAVALRQGLKLRARSRQHATLKIQRWWQTLCSVLRFRIAAEEKRRYAARRRKQEEERQLRDIAARVLQRCVRRRRNRM